MEHVTIYRDSETFAAWPFAHGFWAFSDGELLVGFTRAPCAYREPNDVFHGTVDAAADYVTLRSSDGGHTWPLETLQTLATNSSLRETVLGGAAATGPVEPPDWTSPDFCLTAGFGTPPAGAVRGYVQYSMDRGANWDGPFVVGPLGTEHTPGFGHIQVKPDYIVRSDGTALLFVTVARSDRSTDAKHPGRFGTRFVAVYATTDRGVTWSYLSAIQSIAQDTAFIERYYASPVLLPDGRILVALRCQLNGENAWPEIYESDDNGWSWRFISRVNDWGSPTHLRRLRDGRLLAVFGYRVPPFGIRARVSEDDGRSWGPEIVLRDDGGSDDLGYPRVVELADGNVLAAYYFNSADDPIQCAGGVRHIAGTIFSP